MGNAFRERRVTANDNARLVMLEIRGHQGVSHDNGIRSYRGFDNDSDQFICAFEVTLNMRMDLDDNSIEKLLTRVGCRLYPGEARNIRIGQDVADHFRR